VIVVDHADLAPFTTFAVPGRCRALITVTSVDELRQALHHHPTALVLGGGSNILVTQDIDRPVIRVELRGIALDGLQVTAAAGETWHELVTWCVEQDLGGLENLALIPGTVGAAPLQNIGAYGVEQEQCFVQLTAVHRQTLKEVVFTKDQCHFGYRTSIFKEGARDQYVITSVTYQLTDHPHRLHTSYKDVAEELLQHHAPLTIRDVYDAVVAIRRRKLPDPTEIGNAGSFFKNPVVDAETFSRIHSQHPEVPSYPQADGTIKLPAAWLIDQCGWKGARHGAAGVHERQALVLVNHGGATGAEILALALEIRSSVQAHFGVELHPEVNIW